jgi:hypothetical protein
VRLYGVVSTEAESPFELFEEREDAEQFIEDVRRDDAELAEWPRVERSSSIEEVGGRTSTRRPASRGLLRLLSK